MRAVLIVLFWTWLAVSVAVYGYRLWRRISQGPKAARAAKAATDEGRAVGLGGIPGTPGEAPDLDRPRPPGDPVDRPDRPPVGADPPAAQRPPTVPSPGGPPDVQTHTVAEALRGMPLPCDLVPIADAEDTASSTGRRVVFTTRTSDVHTVAAGLADELTILGYRVDDTPTDVSGTRRRLIATRADATLSVTVAHDATGAVAAEVST